MAHAPHDHSCESRCSGQGSCYLLPGPWRYADLEKWGLRNDWSLQEVGNAGEKGYNGRLPPHGTPPTPERTQPSLQWPPCGSSSCLPGVQHPRATGPRCLCSREGWAEQGTWLRGRAAAGAQGGTRLHAGLAHLMQGLALVFKELTKTTLASTPAPRAGFLGFLRQRRNRAQKETGAGAETSEYVRRAGKSRWPGRTCRVPLQRLGGDETLQANSLWRPRCNPDLSWPLRAACCCHKKGPQGGHQPCVHKQSSGT